MMMMLMMMIMCNGVHAFALHTVSVLVVTCDRMLQIRYVDGRVCTCTIHKCLSTLLYLTNASHLQLLYGEMHFKYSNFLTFVNIAACMTHDINTHTRKHTNMNKHTTHHLISKCEKWINASRNCMRMHSHMTDASRKRGKCFYNFILIQFHGASRD